MKRALLHLTMLIFACTVAVGQSQYKVLYSFGALGTGDGYNPVAGFVYRAGVLYGVTQFGGSEGCYYAIPGCGTVFAMQTFDNSVTEAVIYSFCPSGDPSNCPDGLQPTGGLIADQAGNLYGTTYWGGTGNSCGQFGGCGTVFELTQVSKEAWSETVLHSFTGSDGFGPVGLTFDGVGNLYGTTEAGGAYGAGDVFELSPGLGGTWTLTTLHDFDPATTDGGGPNAGVTFNSVGNLYGTTAFGGGTGCNARPKGCGTVFQLAPNGDGTWTEDIIYRFRGEQRYPLSGVTFDKSGNLYGTTEGDDGTHSWGGVFQLISESGTWKESSFQFDGSDGLEPAAAVVLQGSALFGTTIASTNCPIGDCGNVFEIQGGKEIVLYNFCPLGSPCLDGYHPAVGGPLLAGQGSLYGATRAGGTYGGGVIFQITP